MLTFRVALLLVFIIFSFTAFAQSINEIKIDSLKNMLTSASIENLAKINSKRVEV